VEILMINLTLGSPTDWPGADAMRERFEAILNDTPTQPGIYAARQWYGWRILEWHEGAWWHIGRVSAWPKRAEIDAFVGPLPVISRDYSVPEKPVMEFDL